MTLLELPVLQEAYVQVAPSGLPLIAGLHADCADQPQGRCSVGEDHDYPGPSLDLLVEPLRAVGGPYPLSVRLREEKAAQAVLDVVVQLLRDVGTEEGPPVERLREVILCRVEIRGVEDGAKLGVQLLLLTLGRKRQDVTDEVALASLPGSSLEVAPGRCLDAIVVIGRDHFNAGEPSSLQGLEQLGPGGCVLGVGDVHCDDLTLALGVYGDHHEYSLIDHPPVDPHLLVAGVDQEVWALAL